jgi:hypothetical protein
MSKDNIRNRVALMGTISKKECALLDHSEQPFINQPVLSKDRLLDALPDGLDLLNMSSRSPDMNPYHVPLYNERTSKDKTLEKDVSKTFRSEGIANPAKLIIKSLPMLM